MTKTQSNLVLIGMPGSGKSTIGVMLAKRTFRDFVDTDLLIQSSQQKSLQDIVDSSGYIALRKIEEEILLGLSLQNHVIATGGSAAYSEQAMTHLKSNGTLIFLDVDLATLEARIEARYRAWRADLMRAVLLWYRDRLMLVCGRGEDAIYYGERMESLKGSIEGVDVAQALSDVEAVGAMNRRLEKNLAEGPVLGFGFGAIVSGQRICRQPRRT